ncbi:MAG: FAD-dependent oxidoreductase [Microthrixaceae bacterium]
MHEHTTPSGEHTPPSLERHCDVAVIGGSAAGLAAALQIARQRRSIVVIDDMRPRNAPAAHMHGYLGHDGLPPSELVAIGREEVRSYGGEVLTGRALDVQRRPDGRFCVELAGGTRVIARKLIAATGLVDVLPQIDGLAEHWGRDVIHCPFCHGYEVRDRRLVQILTHPMGLHPALLFNHLSAQLDIVVHGDIDPDAAEVTALRSAGVEFHHSAARRVVADEAGHVVAVELEDGTRLDADAVVVGTRFEVRVEPFASLGLATVEHASGLGNVVETDATGATSVPGLYAAGNVTDPSQQVLGAAANGSWAGAMVCSVLAHEELGADAATPGNEADWDHRYSGERIWSGNPNGSMVAEVESMWPGRVLDVGAGEGGDAVWLAERGWTVTASDISQRALDRIAAEVERRGLSVELLHADANALAPYEPARFDLVSAQYASIPRTPDQRGVQNLLGAVAPGGTLLVVGHDLTPLRTAVDPAVQARPFDPDAYVRPDDLLAALADDPQWEIELHETRPRPPGAASGGHHVDDVVLRARRRPA